MTSLITNSQIDLLLKAFISIELISIIYLQMLLANHFLIDFLSLFEAHDITDPHTVPERGQPNPGFGDEATPYSNQNNSGYGG